MKLVSYQYQKKSGIGIVEGEHVIPLADGISMLEVMERGFDVYAREEPIPLQECQLFSPIDRPRKIYCVLGEIIMTMLLRWAENKVFQKS